MYLYNNNNAILITGDVGGVFVYFKAVFVYAVQFHCICHRGDLAVGNLLLLVPELVIVNDLITQIYLWIHTSKNKHKFERKAKELNECFETVKQSFVLFVCLCLLLSSLCVCVCIL